MISEQMKRILIELTFKEFNIQAVDIKNILTENNTITYDILDEENIKVILIFDFNTETFTVKLEDGYSETRKLIILDDIPINI